MNWGKQFVVLQNIYRGRTDVKTGKSLNKPQDIIRAKGAYLSKDRDEDGLMLNASVKDNLFMPSAGLLANKHGLIALKKIRNLTSDAVATMSIKTFDPYQQKVVSLSGGNKTEGKFKQMACEGLKLYDPPLPTKGRRCRSQSLHLQDYGRSKRRRYR